LLSGIKPWRFSTDSYGPGNVCDAMQRKARNNVLDLLRGRPDLKATLVADAPEAMARLLVRR
jgi:hypothetical protein